MEIHRTLVDRYQLVEVIGRGGMGTCIARPTAS